MARWIAISDSHGDMAEPGVLRVVRDFCKVWKPEVRLHLGDAFDFRPLRQKASEKEKDDPNLKYDWECGKDLLSWYKPTHFCWGNHDYRLFERLEDATHATVREMCEKWIGDIRSTLPRGCVSVPYDADLGVIKYGDHKFVHGYFEGKNASKSHAETYGSCFFGHTHAREELSVVSHVPHTAYNIGCLCKLSMPYNRKKPSRLRHRHSFAYGTETDGRLTAWLAKEVAGNWILPTEMRTFDSSQRLCTNYEGKARTKG